jgi:acyl-CoA thioester hydrolase
VERQGPKPRSDYRHFERLTTRWHDNDVYGHINNVVYYAFFDTAVNRYLIDHTGLEIGISPIRGLVVSTTCAYFESLAYPDEIEVGIAVTRLGTSSVIYDVGVFKAGAERTAAAGAFTHVYVDAATGRPTPIPPRVQEGLARIQR